MMGRMALTSQGDTGTPVLARAAAERLRLLPRGQGHLHDEVIGVGVFVAGLAAIIPEVLADAV